MEKIGSSHLLTLEGFEQHSYIWLTHLKLQ